MPTSTHDDGFHEIQLNGKQLVFLFMTGTVVAVVIFLLGVFVGRGVRAEVGDTTPVTAEQLPPPDIPPVPAAGSTDVPASASEDLSYASRLSSAEPPRETLKPPSPEPVAPRAEPAKPPAAPTARAEAAPRASVASEPPGDGFSIQLAALGKREEAESIVRRLADKGYSAYLVEPANGAPAVFRVRVGKFKDRSEAESVSARLAQEEQFKPWIVR